MRSYTVWLLTSLVLFSFACPRKQADAPVVVHVFRDPGGPAAKKIDSVLHAVRARRLTTSQGHSIIIATVEPKSYQDALTSLGKELHPEIVILNSDKDRLTSGLSLSSEDLIGQPKLPCVAGIPSWTMGEERDAAERVLRAISDELQH